ncbi:hypothetical protein [Hyunsoonleella rubra]|uniref:Lipocalin-like domain-containing protein n=1 Tax=Hyunsoonleella rubra TaxID=1737062 RepID=A0ABW5TI40_9FLAO
MKTLKLYVYAIMALSIMNYSCSSDSDSGSGSGNEELANQQNQTEETPIETSALESGVEIQGATKNNGTPPAPNSNLNLTLDSPVAEAQQKSGFNLKFSTTEADVAGAYLQFKDLDGNTAGNYFDVASSNFVADKKANIKGSATSKGGLFSKGSSLEDGDYEIDVDFGDDIPAGQFCADLCIYNSQEQISQIVTVCVEVEAWGGNASLVGEWEIIDSTDDDELETINCNNGENVEVFYYQTISESNSLKIESDGDYIYSDNEEFKFLDYQATSDNCSATYNDEVFNYSIKESGKWSFNESDNTLTLVLFKYEDLITPADSYDEPNGELILEKAAVSFVNGNLIITETYSDGSQTYTDVYTLRRK